jgi:hypothetical protein
MRHPHRHAKQPSSLGRGRAADGQEPTLALRRSRSAVAWIADAHHVNELSGVHCPRSPEVSIEAARHSCGRHVDRAELEDLIRSLPGTFDEATIPGLPYRPW